MVISTADATVTAIDALAMTTAAPRGVVARSTAASSRRSSLVSCGASGRVALVVTVASDSSIERLEGEEASGGREVRRRAVPSPP
jgi:hypothetical protein